MDRFDALFLVGVGCLEFGVWQWSPAAAWVLAGVVLIIASLAADLRSRVRHLIRETDHGTRR